MARVELLPPIYLLNVWRKGTGVSGNVFLGDCAIVDFPEEIVSLVRTDAWLKLSVNTDMTSIMMRLTASEIISVYIEISVVAIAEERKTLSDIMVIKLVSKPTTIPKTNISNTDDTTFGFDIEIHALIIKITVIELIHLFSERVIVNIGRETINLSVFEQSLLPIFKVKVVILPNVVDRFSGFHVRTSIILFEFILNHPRWFVKGLN